MAACEDEIGIKGAPRWTRGYARGRKQSVELFKFYISSKSMRSDYIL